MIPTTDFVYPEDEQQVEPNHEQANAILELLTECALPKRGSSFRPNGRAGWINCVALLLVLAPSKVYAQVDANSLNSVAGKLNIPQKTLDFAASSVRRLVREAAGRGL